MGLSFLSARRRPIRPPQGKLLAGGDEAPGDGHFIRPTVIADMKPEVRIAQEEIFGPVLAVIPAKD